MTRAPSVRSGIALAIGHACLWLMVAAAVLVSYGYVQHGDEQAQQEAEEQSGTAAWTVAAP